MTTPNPTYDVIVIGAGLSGLMAARRLTEQGKRVLVLEAHAQVGGRTRTTQVNGVAFDIGGQWTGPGQPRVNALIDEYGLNTLKTHVSGKRVMSLKKRVSTYSGTIPRLGLWKLLRAQWGIWKIEKLCKEVSRSHPWQHPKAHEWDAMTARDWARRHIVNPDVISLVNAATRVVFGQDLDELSFLYFLYYFRSGGGFTKLVESHEGNQDRRIVGGAQQLSRRLAANLSHVQTSTVAQHIVQEDTSVTVHAENGSWRAQRVIVAVPLPMADRLQYSPPVPTLRDQLTQRCSMGATVKVLALYAEAFWRDANLSGEAVCTDGPVSVAFDNTSESGQPCLVAFVTGKPARGWAEKPSAERREAVLENLVRFFGEQARKPSHYLEQDWATEPFIGGAPTANFPPGTLSVFGPALRAPFQRIHWAGTETARESTGFMEGALESGERAAEEVLQSLHSEH